MTWVYSECTKRQPLACLSRGIAGVRNRTLIANLPGNPQGVHEVMVILMPLLLHALQDMRENVQP
jgi:molybdopterin adenylyltransferase